jgi:hypothetical protein
VDAALVLLARRVPIQGGMKDVLELIRSEYREMPDLHLTPVQMQRMWGVGPQTCAEVVDALLAERAVRLTLAGAYVAIRGRALGTLKAES